FPDIQSDSFDVSKFQFFSREIDFDQPPTSQSNQLLTEFTPASFLMEDATSVACFINLTDEVGNTYTRYPEMVQWSQEKRNEWLNDSGSRAMLILLPCDQPWYEPAQIDVDDAVEVICNGDPVTLTPVAFCSGQVFAVTGNADREDVRALLIGGSASGRNRRRMQSAETLVMLHGYPSY
ncbi:MAG: hypothetical protein AAF456_24535, partial [Planctomycetota bacterium]